RQGFAEYRERNPKSDARCSNERQIAHSQFGFRSSDFFRISGFGFRIFLAPMNLSHPHFAEPRWLWLAALGPLVVVILYRYAAWARGRQLVQLAAPRFLQDLIRSHSPLRRAIKHGFLVLVVAAIGLALARPQWGEASNVGQLLGQDVVFVLDCSRSM